MNPGTSGRKEARKWRLPIAATRFALGAGPGEIAEVGRCWDWSTREVPGGRELDHLGIASKAMVMRASSVVNGTVPCHM